MAMMRTAALMIAAVARVAAEGGACEDGGPYIMEGNNLEITCAMLKSIGTCGCPLVGGEDMINWRVDGQAGAGWIPGCTPTGASFSTTPTNMDPKDDLTLVSALCPTTCAAAGCGVPSPPSPPSLPPLTPMAANPYKPEDDSDATLINLFGGNAAATCAFCGVKNSQCAQGFCGKGTGSLCPYSCYENDPHNFRLAGWDKLDLTQDNNAIITSIWGLTATCESLGVTQGAIFQCMESRGLLWLYACPVACANFLEASGWNTEFCAPDDPDFKDEVDQKACGDWAGACSTKMQAIEQPATGYLGDCSEDAWAARNETAAAAGTPIAAGTACEVGGYFTAGKFYTAAQMDAIRTACPTSCMHECHAPPSPPSPSPEEATPEEEAVPEATPEATSPKSGCVPCDRARSLLFSSGPTVNCC